MMPSLNHALTTSYTEHPAFASDLDSWEVNASSLATFRQICQALQGFGSRLAQRERAWLRDEGIASISQVFAGLRQQTADDLEACFVDELKGACIRLFREEVDWYAKPAGQGFVGLADRSSREAALEMAGQRHFFGRLSADALNAIAELAQEPVEQFRINARAGRLRREDLSVSTGPTPRAIRTILNRDFASLGVLDVLSAYTGRRIRVDGLALELSVPQATWWRNAIPGLERPPRTLYAHLDETISCPKAIVYLTDVGVQNGPTGCYPGAYEALQLDPLQELIGRVVGTVGNGADSKLNAPYAKQYHQSMNSQLFRRHFMRLPPCLRFNSHLGWDVRPGSGLEDALAAGERQMLGPAGTFIAFDGARLLHRGGLMEEGERVALQVIFSDVTPLRRIANKALRTISWV